MPLENLLRALEHEAQLEVEAATADDVRRALEIVADARAEAARERDQVLASVRRDASDEAARRVAAARARLRAEERADLEAHLGDVRDRAQDALGGLRGTAEGRRATLLLLGDALQHLPDARRCRVAPEAADEVRRLRHGLVVEPDLDDLGVVLHDDRGRSLDSSARTRLANAWPQLRPPLAARWDAR